MAKKILFLALFFASIVQAQEYKIIGSVVDKTTKQPLEAATIYAESLSDSALISYTISNQKGTFDLALRTKAPKVNLAISFTGYSTLRKEITLKGSTINMGVLGLDIESITLEGVSVVADRAPIIVKKDTLEFNAESFKTRPDANVEDLIKLLPGAQVDSDGKITVNGKEVNRVLVNGKEFFGSDPKIATKNLPKDIVDKIQVTDTKSETERFTGRQSTSDTQTLNITIKKDKNKGYMGRITAGYGTDERYQLSGVANYFNDKQRFSILAGGNNINSAGFSFDEVFDAVGRRGQGVSFNSRGSFNIGGMNFGGGQGITTSYNVGGNYADELSDKTEITADYFFASSETYNDSKTERENILPDRRFFTNSESHSDGGSDSHRANARLIFQLDSMTRLTVSPNFNTSLGDSRNVRTEVSIDEDGNVINDASTNNNSLNDRKSFSNDVNLIRKLNSKGNYLKFGFSNDNSRTDGTSKLLSENNVYGNNPSTLIRDQVTKTDNQSDSWNANVEWRQALIGKLFLDLGYSFDNSLRSDSRIVNDYDNVTGEYSSFNQALSSDFRFKSMQHSPSAGFNYEGEKLSVGLGSRMVNTRLSNNDYIQLVDFEKDFNNVLFNANVRYRLDRGKSFSTNYRSSANVPSVSQLQPIENISNPLNIIVGNPDLKPTISHNFFMNYNNFDFRTRSGIFMFGSFNFDNDRITNTTITDENFLRRTTYTNVNGNYSGNIGGHFNKQYKSEEGVMYRFRIGGNASLNNNISFNNNVKFTSKTFNYAPNVGLTFNYKEQFEINPGYSVGFNKTTYSLDRFEDINFMTHTFEVRATTYWPKNVVWGNDITYNYNGSVSDNFDKSAIFWNMSLGLKLWNDKGNLKLIAYDLLDQNINTRRTATEDYIQDTQGTVLKRYFMASFTFKFDQFGGKDLVEVEVLEALCV